MKEKINVIITIEMMGKPPEHLKDTISKFIEGMNAEKGVKILGKKIYEVKKIENSELFSTFAEVELELDDIYQLFMIIFTYMPSHIDIIKPEELKMKNSDLNVLCNELTRRLHEYDSVAKTIIFEKKILESQLTKKNTEKKSKRIKASKKEEKEII